jgi:hypothetical protein
VVSMVVAEKTRQGTDALHQFLEADFPGAYISYVVCSNLMRTSEYH